MRLFGPRKEVAQLTEQLMGWVGAKYDSTHVYVAVSDMDQALAAARQSGAEVIVDKFKDAIGYDAVIQCSGGVQMQLYWHFTAPSYAPLATVPDSRVYLSADSADAFLRDFLKFSHGKIISDDRKADAGEIGRRGESIRRVRVESGFGRMQVMVTDGH